MYRGVGHTIPRAEWVTDILSEVGKGVPGISEGEKGPPFSRPQREPYPLKSTIETLELNRTLLNWIQWYGTNRTNTHYMQGQW